MDPWEEQRLPLGRPASLAGPSAGFCASLARWLRSWAASSFVIMVPGRSLRGLNTRI